MVDGVGKLRMRRRGRDGAAVIMLAPAHHGPAVIRTRGGNVELIAAHRAELALPKLAGFGVNGDALGIAVAVGPDLGLGVYLPDKGIVLRHGAVGIDAHDLAEMIGKVLGRLELKALAECDEQSAVGGEGEPAAEMERPVDLGRPRTK